MLATAAQQSLMTTFAHGRARINKFSKISDVIKFIWRERPLHWVLFDAMVFSDSENPFGFRIKNLEENEEDIVLQGVEVSALCQDNQLCANN